MIKKMLSGAIIISIIFWGYNYAESMISKKSDKRWDSLYEVKNIGLAIESLGSKITKIDKHVYALVSETGQGGTDLNGDSDINDNVLHTIKSKETINNQVAADKLLYIATSGRLVAYTVSEVDQGNTDLNGDGDIDDFVFHVNGSNLNLAGTSLYAKESANSDIVALIVSESMQFGLDLNGDGDSLDDVLAFYYDHSSGVTTQLFYGVSSENHFIDDDRFTFGLYEGNVSIDYTMDGDFNDAVLGIYDTTSFSYVIINLPLAPFSLDDLTISNDGKYITETFDENYISADLNGDGDTIDDSIMGLFDVSGPVPVNILTIATDFGAITIIDGLVSFSVNEFEQGGIDLNGDLDVYDHVAHLYHIPTNTLTNLGLAANSTGGSDKIIGYFASEWGQGFTDLNGDGDFDDNIAFVYDIDSSTLLNLQLAIWSKSGVVDDVHFFAVHEQGQSTDFNNDGDISDEVMHLYFENGKLFNLGLSYGGNIEFSDKDKLISFFVPESSQGDSDLNGDLDADDKVLHTIQLF